MRYVAKQMAGHWLSKSQFMPIPEADYRTLQAAAGGRAFTIEYGALFDQLFPELRDGGNAYRRELSAQLRERRSFFDNTHDTMRDVWPFPRVTGEDRQGHATPKPVAMVERAFRSSSCEGDAIGVPFGGSGPDVVAAHLTGRRAYVMELQPEYCDVIARRYQDLTGDLPVLERTGERFDFHGADGPVAVAA